MRLQKGRPSTFMGHSGIIEHRTFSALRVVDGFSSPPVWKNNKKCSSKTQTFPNNLGKVNFFRKLLETTTSTCMQVIYIIRMCKFQVSVSTSFDGNLCVYVKEFEIKLRFLSFCSSSLKELLVDFSGFYHPTSQKWLEKNWRLPTKKQKGCLQMITAILFYLNKEKSQLGPGRNKAFFLELFNHWFPFIRPFFSGLISWGGWHWLDSFPWFSSNWPADQLREPKHRRPGKGWRDRDQTFLGKIGEP